MGVNPPLKGRSVFLDRDGVINLAYIRDGKPYPPKSISEFVVLPKVREALVNLSASGWLLIVITNQPDVARGTLSREAVEEINRFMLAELPIVNIKTCYHDNRELCLCRKPKPGALLEAAREYDIDLSSSYMVGDRWRDIEAGKNAGCKTIFIDNNYNEKRPIAPDYTVKNLPEASNIILGKKDEKNN